MLVVRKADFKELLSLHVELYEALLRLNCRRLRLLFDTVEDLNTLPLSARLAKQILLLARSYGVEQGDEIRVGLQLAQEDIAQLLGASRQRVNQELKGFEREGAVRIEPTRLVVLSRDKLLAIANRWSGPMSTPEANTGTSPVAEQHAFDVAALERWLASTCPASRAARVEQFKGGQSNPTYLRDGGARRYVLRRKPPARSCCPRRTPSIASTA